MAMNQLSGSKGSCLSFLRSSAIKMFRTALQVPAAEVTDAQATNAATTGAATGAKPAQAGDGNKGPFKGSKYKTEMCKYFINQRCTRGASCLYAHSTDEMPPFARAGVSSLPSHEGCSLTTALIVVGSSFIKLSSEMMFQILACLQCYTSAQLDNFLQLCTTDWSSRAVRAICCPLICFLSQASEYRATPDLHLMTGTTLPSLSSSKEQGPCSGVVRRNVSKLLWPLVSLHQP